MCYDMSFFASIKLAAQYLKIPDPGDLDFFPTYHQVAQTYCKWPVAINDGGIKIKLFEWGLIANYMNTPEKIKQYRSSMANARSEKMLDDSASVWHRLRHQRCLVFTTGFFEHRDIGAKKKLPYFITIKDQPVFCFAGLYHYSPMPDKETGEMFGTFAIVTKPANDLMAKIHNAKPNGNRMPVVLTQQDAQKWLQPDLSDAEVRQIMDYEFPSSQMVSWPVHSIRTRKMDDENIIAPLTGEMVPPL
jgi:putative SOS response-associated peptidase YedK